MEDYYRKYLAANLKLTPDTLQPLEGSVADGAVVIESLAIYTSGFPVLCPDGREITRPTIHSTLRVPVKPTLYRALLGVDTVSLKVHIDSELLMLK